MFDIFDWIDAANAAEMHGPPLPPPKPLKLSKPWMMKSEDEREAELGSATTRSALAAWAIANNDY